MTINYTTLLGLAQPVTGTEANTWGDVVNDEITALIEEAIAGGETINVTAGDVTLTDTDGTLNQARNAILLITGTPGVSRNVIAPSTSKVYIVRNGSDAAVVIKGAATTGVSVPSGGTSVVFWNGSDFQTNESMTELIVAAGAVGTPSITTAGDLNTGIFFPAADTIAFAEGGVEAMRITSGGALTIGSTTAINDAVGSLQLSGTGAGSTSGAGILNFFRPETDGVGTGDHLGSILFFGADTTGNTPTLLSSIRATASGTHAAGDNPTDIVFGTTPDGSATVTEVVRFNQAGNVGIGTSSPTQKLDISSSGDPTSATGTSSIRLSNTVSGRVGLIGVDDSQNLIIWDSTSSPTTGNGAIKFLNGGGTGTERMRIDSSGNVGIGTSSPVNMLHLSNTAAETHDLAFSRNTTYGTSTGIGGVSWYNQGGTTRLSRIASETDGASTSTRLTFLTSSSGTEAERMRIDSSGNVGIGTSSPTAELDVVKSVNGGVVQVLAANTYYDASSIDEAVAFQGEFYQNDVAARRAAGYIKFTKAGDFSNNANASANMLFATRNAGTLAERMRITSAGEVLVGGTTEIASSGALTVQKTDSGSLLYLYRNDTSVVSGNTIGLIGFYGNDTTSNTPTRLAYISADASGTHAAGDNPTDLVFGTTPDGTETVAEAGRITQSGAYVLKGGTTTAAAGVGIIFPATQVASADVNCLDDYEEGTFTPSWAFSTSGSVTYTNGVRNGKYTKIGNRVFFEISLQTASISSPTGDATITGLPFTSSSVSPNSSIYVGYKRRWATDMPNLTGLVTQNATSISLVKNASNVTTEVYLLGSDFSASTNYNTLYIAGHYSV